MHEQFFSLLQYVIKVLYAGQDTSFVDDNHKAIFTGDIIKIKGTFQGESGRDPMKYFKKDRLVISGMNNPLECYGVVSSFSNCPEAFQVVLDNHGFFLCLGTEMEILGNIFYDLIPDERIHVCAFACSLAQSGYLPDSFWRKHSRETIKEDLKMIKTPHFQKKENKRKNRSLMTKVREILNRGKEYR